MIVNIHPDIRCRRPGPRAPSKNVEKYVADVIQMYYKKRRFGGYRRRSFGGYRRRRYSNIRRRYYRRRRW